MSASYAWLFLDLALFLAAASLVSPFFRLLVWSRRTFSERWVQHHSERSSESSQRHAPIATIAPPLKNRHA